jgi:hypothetical protein
MQKKDLQIGALSMARFYPTIDKNFHGSDGEQLVYNALRQGLSDNFS